ncbi:unnamed protein product [Closterium sp. NIES-64]|nr:unnamed protein product [Closterium sp. NIES-64]
MAAVSADAVCAWLLQTTSADEAAVRSASSALEEASKHPGFLGHVLSVAAVPNSPAALPAALYFKNVAVAKWRGAGSKGRVQLPGGKEEQEAVRVQLVEVLLRSGQGKILSVLIEAFSAVVRTELASPSGWPQLLPGLKAALLSSDLIRAIGSASAAAPGPSDPASAAATFSTVTVLTVLRAVTKPYRYFLDPTNDKEPVPPVLEAIASDLLLPLMPLMHHLIAAQAQQSSPRAPSAHDEALLLILKTLHLSVQSHMPSAIRKHIDSIVPELLLLLSHCPPTLAAAVAAAGQEEGEVMDGEGGAEGGGAAAVWEVRLKGCKRALQICHALASRHQKLTNKHFPAMVDGITGIVCNSLWTNKLPLAARRVIAVAFTAISQVLDSAPGWKVVAPQFAHLLEAAIFPALCLHPQDLELWEEDEEEYVRRNLPTDLDDMDEMESYDPRQCAAHLLALIATSKGSPAKGKPGAAGAAAGKSTSPAAGRRRQRRPAATKDTDAAAATVVLPFLSRFPLPADAAVPMEGMFVAGAGGGQAPANPASAAVVHYFGVLQAYAAMKEYFERQPAHLEQLLPAHVLPLFSQRHVSAVLLASATWLLGELSTALPESLHNPVYEASMKAMAAGDVDGQSWAAVRTAASHCISYLIQNEVEPSDWLAFLQAVVAATRAGEEREAVRALDLLESVAVEGGEGVHAHLPAIIAAVANDTCAALPPPDQPWALDLLESVAVEGCEGVHAHLPAIISAVADDTCAALPPPDQPWSQERGTVREERGAVGEERGTVGEERGTVRAERGTVGEERGTVRAEMACTPTSPQASLLLQLLTFESTQILPAIIAAVAADACAALPPPDQPWSQVGVLLVECVWGQPGIACVGALLCACLSCESWADDDLPGSRGETDRVWALFSALASLVESWADDDLPGDDDEEEEGEERDGKEAAGAEERSRRAVEVAASVARVLRVAWLNEPVDPSLVKPQAAATLEGEEDKEPPPTSWFDASLLLSFVLKAAANAPASPSSTSAATGGDAAALVAQWGVVPLLHKWVELVAEWTAWEEDEDEAVFQTIDSLLLLQGRTPVPDFISRATPPPPLPPVPARSILEGVACFISSALSDGSPAATWRASRHSHTLLNAAAVALNGGPAAAALAARFAEASLTRLSTAPSLSSIRYITKPLLLALFSSLLASPSSVFPLLLSPAPAGDKGKVEAGQEEGEGEGEKEEGLMLGVVVRGVESLLALHAEPGLVLESELKLTVLALTCLVQQSAAAAAVTGSDLPAAVLAAAMAAMVRLKEVKEETSSKEGSEEGEEDEEDEEEEDEDDEEPALDENLDDAELEAALMRRYAEAAKMIGSLEEDEADVEDEYGVELELGLTGLQDEQAGIRACLQQHWAALGRQVVALKPSLSSNFAEAFPPAKPFLL